MQSIHEILNREEKKNLKKEKKKKSKQTKKIKPKPPQEQTPKPKHTPRRWKEKPHTKTCIKLRII